MCPVLPGAGRQRERQGEPGRRGGGAGRAAARRATGREEAPIFVADSGLYSADERRPPLTQRGCAGSVACPTPPRRRSAALAVADEAWQQEGDLFWASVPQAPAGERWVVVRTTRARSGPARRSQRQVEQTRAQWEKALWHLGNQRFACVPDAQAALAQQLKQRPAVAAGAGAARHAQPKHRRPGRPRTGRAARPASSGRSRRPWPSTRRPSRARCGAKPPSWSRPTCSIPTQLSDQELIQTYKEQHSVERGFSFLKDPLFLASSVFVKKPERIVALSLVMVLCLLVYRLAEHRLREQLAATGQTVPNQLKQPTDRPTLRWIFQCFEGMSLVDLPATPGPTAPGSGRPGAAA